jgi:hypothetical protein
VIWRYLFWYHVKSYFIQKIIINLIKNNEFNSFVNASTYNTSKKIMNFFMSLIVLLILQRTIQAKIMILVWS